MRATWFLAIVAFIASFFQSTLVKVLIMVHLLPCQSKARKQHEKFRYTYMHRISGLPKSPTISSIMFCLLYRQRSALGSQKGNFLRFIKCCASTLYVAIVNVFLFWSLRWTTRHS